MTKSPSVVIHYCSTCGFRKHAERIAEHIERELSLPCQLQKGFWGTFRIESDGQEIYNRWKTRGWLGRLGLGHNPQPDEIVARLRQTEQPKSGREPQANALRAATP